MEGKGEVLIYQTEDGKSELEVRLDQETIWLTQDQMGSLFEKSKKTISEHLGNIFKENELKKQAVVRKFRTTANDGKSYNYDVYNLDVIISIGYRVKSKRGTQFRIWATNTLKDHLVKGYTINEKRLQEQEEKFKELNKTVEFLKTTIGNKQLTNKETQGLLEIISKYTRSFVLLNQFDSNSLENEPSDKALTHEINYKEAIADIEQLKKKLIAEGEASDLLAGKEKKPSAEF
jgi:hypothetical protein